MKRPALKRALVAATLVLGSLSPAFATTQYVMQYHDTIRPNGHKRSKAVGDAALAACFSQTGLSRYAAASPAFKDCMKDHGYQWVSTKLVQNPPSKQTSDDSGFIDPDNGMLCHDVGFGTVYVPPQGTGIMSVSGSF